MPTRLIKDGLFKYGRVYSCRPQGAMELTLNGGRIDNLAHVRGENHPEQIHFACFCIHLNLCKQNQKVGHGIVGVESPETGDCMHETKDLPPGNTCIRSAFDIYHAIFAFQIFWGHFQHGGSLFQEVFPGVLGRGYHGGAHGKGAPGAEKSRVVRIDKAVSRRYGDIL